MKAYKVTFKDNRADTAIFQGYSFDGAVEIEHNDGKRILVSLMVLADNAQQSIIEADVIARDYCHFQNAPLDKIKPKFYKHFGNFNCN